MLPFIVYIRRQLLRLCKDVDQSSRAAGKVVAVKSDNSGYEHVTLSKSSVGLSNVDNTSDANKPVSTATQSALNSKAGLSSNTFTANQTISGAGSSSLSPRSVEITASAAGQCGRFAIAGEGNSFQAGNGVKMQISAYWGLEISGDRRTNALPFTAWTENQNISLRVISNLPYSRPLVVQGAASQTVNLTEWKDGSGAIGAYISPGFNQQINGWFRPGSVTVATVPTVGVSTGALIDVVDGKNADASAGVTCRWNGTNWRTLFNNTVVTT